MSMTSDERKARFIKRIVIRAVAQHCVLKGQISDNEHRMFAYDVAKAAEAAWEVLPPLCHRQGDEQ